jgi:hypothetical protein
MLCIPKRTDIRPAHPGALGDVIELPSFSGLYWRVTFVADRAKGFPNEYRAATCQALYNFVGAWVYPQP